MSRLENYGVDPQAYDLAIIVSAAGGVDASPSGGAAATLIDQATRSKTRLSSGATFVDIRFMDVMAIAAALHYHRSKMAQAGKTYRALILTENLELVREAEAGNVEGYGWSMLDWFRRNGYDLAWEWQSAAAVSKKADAEAAQRAREAVREATEWIA